MVLKILLGAWALWIVGHLVAMLLVRPNVPCCDGLRIFIPQWAVDKLSHVELRAIYLHEEGHLRARHVWKNFLLVCVFRRASLQRRYEQELEADDYAYKAGYAFALASALRKLGISPQDNVRARRLEMKGSRDVGSPYRAGGTTFQTGEVNE